MTQATVVDSRKVFIWLGAHPVAPAVKICAMTTRGFNQTKDTNTAVIPDCDDPTVVAPVKRTVLSKDAEITGTGYRCHVSDRFRRCEPRLLFRQVLPDHFQHHR
jgi:hypothetical protein